MPTTAKGIRYPASTDPVNIPQDLQNIATDMDGIIGTTAMTTNGDVLTYSTVETRLPLGTDGQLLRPNSATATGLEWATVAKPTTNGHELIATLTATTSPSSFAFTSIPQTYTDLLLVFIGQWNGAKSAIGGLVINSGTTMRYTHVGAPTANNTVFVAAGATGNLPIAGSNTVSTEVPQFANSLQKFHFIDYTSTSWQKLFFYESFNNITSSTADRSVYEGVGRLDTTSALTSITLTHASGFNLWNGSTAYLWGRKRLGL